MTGLFLPFLLATQLGNMAMGNVTFPQGSWDTHVHVFDPVLFPYKPGRAYTPKASGLTSLVESSKCQNFLLTQASVEDGPDGILHHLQSAHEMYPDRQFRAEIMWDNRAAAIGVDALHEMGVRCLRLHGKFGDGNGAHGNMTEAEWTAQELRALREVAAQKGWAVAAQLQMDIWIDVVPGLLELNDLDVSSQVPIVAEHFGSPPPAPLSRAQMSALETFTDFLGQDRGFYVKLSALHRRVSKCAGINSLEHVIAMLASRAPRALLYGSDFPHVNSSAADSQPSDFLPVDHLQEALVLQTTMSDVAWQNMVVDTPLKLWA